MKIKQAVILAGGLGTRLMPLTVDKPKPMVIVAGRPFLEHLIELLRRNGIKEIVMLLGYLPDKITGYFGDGSRFGVKIKYSIGKPEDETGTRIKKAGPFLDENFLLMYCDNYWPLDLKKIMAVWRRSGRMAMMAAYGNKDGGGEYGSGNNLMILKDGTVAKYLKSGYSAGKSYNAIDVGCFILNRKILGMMGSDNFSFQKKILPQLIRSEELAGFIVDHPYYPITDIARLKTAEKFFKPKKVIFLDRDGVINKKMPVHEHVKKWEEFKFLSGTKEALKILKEKGYSAYIISNQSGVGQGLMKASDLKQINNRMKKEIGLAGGKLEKEYYCLHAPEENCYCRKPNAGLLFQAARNHHIDLSKAIFVGDQKTDLRAAQNAGCRFELLSSRKSLKDIVKKLA